MGLMLIFSFFRVCMDARDDCGDVEEVECTTRSCLLGHGR